MLEKTLDQIAQKINGLDEATLTQLLPRYKQKMEDFEATAEWEKAVIIFFLINAVRVKNTIFNENVAQGKNRKSKDKKINPLKLIKS